MANREELLIIRSARAGQSHAQLALGKRYLFGGSGLPQSHATALHCLEKAAEQNMADAWFLIGEHVPFEVAKQSSDPLGVAVWYERDFEGGMAKAGLILAMLVFASWPRADQLLRQRDMRALQAAAESGLADAQWLPSSSVLPMWSRSRNLQSFRPPQGRDAVQRLNGHRGPLEAASCRRSAQSPTTFGA